jgi:opacity protein-like surface antigen
MRPLKTPQQDTMKNYLIAVSSLALPLTINAQRADANDAGTYVRFGAGVAIVEDIEGFFDDLVNPRTEYDLTLDPGVRVGFAPGYRFCRYFGVELNTGFIWNSLDSIETAGGSFSVEGDLLQVPLFGNVILEYPTPAGITPFLGGGGGGSYVRLSIDDGDDEAGDDFFGAFQLLGGLRYEMDPGLSIGLMYTYMHMFSEDEETLFTGETSGLGDITTHSISAVVTFSF